MLEDRDRCEPGDEVVAHIRFYHPEYVAPFLAPRARFQVQEGKRVVGRGVVLNP